MRSFGTILLFALASTLAVQADEGRARIVRADVDLSAGLIFIHGAGFGFRTPVVGLGDTKSVPVSSASPTDVVALLPASITPGTYVLTLLRAGDGHDNAGDNSASIDLTIGAVGPQGPAGRAGAAGAKGDTGMAGPQGPAGAAGPAGAKGDTGMAGPQGIAGAAGPAGAKGDTGMAGPQGFAGAAGPAGVKGDTGMAGPQGFAGAAGPAGVKGDTGMAGPQGPAGAAGPAGATGEAGMAGPQGPAGAAGLAGPAGATGAAGAQGPKGDPGGAGASAQQIALGRWYDANLGAAAIPIASEPYGVTFDGIHLWVSSKGGEGVYKVRASDGAVAGRYPGGDEALAFDGSSIWSCGSNGTLHRLRATDGANTGDFVIGGSLTSIVYDGTNLWLTASTLNLLVEVSTAGEILAKYPTGNYPHGLAFDGAAIWVATNNDGYLTKFDRTTGQPSVHLKFSNEQASGPMVFDGTSLWFATYDALRKVNVADGAVLATVAKANLLGVAFDGADVWYATNMEIGKVSKAGGSARAVSTLTSRPYPRPLAFDGANVWLLDFGGGVIKKY
jgi:hypothetical protein